eukprot:2757416-Pyramimonas_sp.AAC.2
MAPPPTPPPAACLPKVRSWCGAGRQVSRGENLGGNRRSNHGMTGIRHRCVGAPLRALSAFPSDASARPLRGPWCGGSGAGPGAVPRAAQDPGAGGAAPGGVSDASLRADGAQP